MGDDEGENIHSINANVNIIIGVNTNAIMFAMLGTFGIFVKSFTASAIGCGIPANLTLLGPFRSCAYPKIFRSNKVKNAMAARIVAKLIIEEDMKDIIG